MGRQASASHERGEGRAIDEQRLALIVVVNCHAVQRHRRLESAADLSSFGQVVSSQDGLITLQVLKEETARVTGQLLAAWPVLDLTVEDPPIEEVIDHVFAQAAA